MLAGDQGGEAKQHKGNLDLLPTRFGYRFGKWYNRIDLDVGFIAI